MQVVPAKVAIIHVLLYYNDLHLFLGVKLDCNNYTHHNKLHCAFTRKNIISSSTTLAVFTTISKALLRGKKKKKEPPIFLFFFLLMCRRVTLMPSDDFDFLRLNSPPVRGALLQKKFSRPICSVWLSTPAHWILNETTAARLKCS